ncbi:MAG: PAS domain-containing protein [Kordiimonadaceae bacterium]|nr:PAS domain-containing protein [Kordiimonadaceae bacterium]MBO6569833.1 PAS domain-containing protein [Kordiimonadaceae bacterium]MBO6966071.1 PAS domain-containing protein [Kordiimonadaceae bacterium]
MQPNENSPLTMQQLPLTHLPEVTEFKEILSLYASKLEGRLMPRWQDFSFSEFVGWHPRLALSQIEGDDLRFRIFGTAFVELFARDLTGQLLIGSMVAEQTQSTKTHFHALLNGPRIGLAKGRVPAEGRGFLRFEVIDLPLADENGEVSHFLHACAPPTERMSAA